MTGGLLKRLLLIVLSLFIAFISFAQTISEIQDNMIELAGQNDRLELPQLFSQYKDKVEPYVRYYCGTVVSINEGKTREALVYIDSVLLKVPYIFDKNTRTSFANAKAVLLQQEKRYEELVDFCNSFLIEEQLKPGDFMEKELQLLKMDGIDKSRPTNIRGELLWLANYGNPYELKTMYEANKDSVDSYIRLNCERSLAQAFNDNKKAIICIDSLINFYSSQLNSQTLKNNIYRKAEILLDEGDYNVLAEYVESIPEKYKTASAFGYACQWAKSLKGTQSAEIIRPSRDCVISDIVLASNIPLVPGKVNNASCQLLFDTGATYTVIKGSLAREANIKILPDSVMMGWYLYDKYSMGVLAIADSLKVGDIVLKNRIVLVDTSSIVPLDSNVIFFGAPEIKSIGEIEFYTDKIVFPFNSIAKKDEPNFFLEGAGIKVPCFVGEKLYSFDFDTGSSTNYLLESTFLSSGEFLYETKISIDKKSIRLMSFDLSDYKNRLGYSFVESFPKFAINYNTMRIDFDEDSIKMSQYYWIKRRNFFELEKSLQQKDSMYYDLSKTFVINGKNKPNELLLFLDTVFEDTSKKCTSDIDLILRTLRENAFYDSGQYEKAYNCLLEMKSICPESLLPSLEEALKKCKALCGVEPQEIVWNKKEIVLKPLTVLDNKFYYTVKINGMKSLSNISLGSYDCIISMKEARRLGVNIVSDSIEYNGVISKLGVVETISIGKNIAKNVVFYILPEDTTVTVIGKSLLRLIPTIKLSKNEIVFQQKIYDNSNDIIPIRLEKPDLIAQVNSIEGSVIVKFIEGDINILPQSFINNKNVKIGDVRINMNECDFDKELNMVFDMRGEIGLYYLLQQVNSLVFDFKNMAIIYIK